MTNFLLRVGGDVEGTTVQHWPSNHENYKTLKDFDS